MFEKSAKANTAEYPFWTRTVFVFLYIYRDLGSRNNFTMFKKKTPFVETPFIIRTRECSNFIKLPSFAHSRFSTIARCFEISNNHITQ